MKTIDGALHHIDHQIPQPMMAPGRRPFLALALSALAFLLLALAPQAGHAAAQTPHAFLQAIYQHYIGTNTAGVKLDSDADYRRYFTPDLTKIILDDIAKSQKNDDVPTLDGDPFIDAQDWSISKVQIDVDDKATDKTVAKVSFRNSGTPETITLDLVKIDGAWKIDDIHWPEASLRGIYKQ
ncbi:MAG TPA: DUF3828 domain-containing protein [Terriglobales bacterium]|nr:DUF3828 domain-containing protein [Terriglobales bacterium]